MVIYFRESGEKGHLFLRKTFGVLGSREQGSEE